MGKWRRLIQTQAQEKVDEFTKESILSKRTSSLCETTEEPEKKQRIVSDLDVLENNFPMAMAELVVLQCAWEEYKSFIPHFVFYFMFHQSHDKLGLVEY